MEPESQLRRLIGQWAEGPAVEPLLGIGPKRDPAGVDIKVEDGTLSLSPTTPADDAITGTIRAILANMVKGVSEGFEKKLELAGVGYRVQQKGKNLEFSLGFSHPVIVEAPEGITFEVPDNTHVNVKGINKQQVGQIAAEIRGHRPPEPYKGKGIRYADEKVVIKETKKK